MHVYELLKSGMGKAISAVPLPMYGTEIYSWPPSQISTCLKMYVLYMHINVVFLYTVDGIMFVVDSGYCKLKVYNPRIGIWMPYKCTLLVRYPMATLPS